MRVKMGEQKRKITELRNCNRIKLLYQYQEREERKYAFKKRIEKSLIASFILQNSPRDAHINYTMNAHT